jgi:hypothetical protein
VIEEIERGTVGRPYVPLEPRDGGEPIVGNVQFLEVDEVLEASDPGYSIGLDGDDFEISQSGDVLRALVSYWSPQNTRFWYAIL